MKNSLFRHMVCAATIGGIVLTSAQVYAHGDEPHEKSNAAVSKKAYDGHAANMGEPGDASKVTRTIKLEMGDNMRYTPASVSIKRGETIRFEVSNKGQVKHEMVLGSMKELKEHAEMMRKFPEMQHDDPNAVSVAPGATGSFVWRFTKTGTFDFACLVPGHFEAGMIGKIGVAAK